MITPSGRSAQPGEANREHACPADATCSVNPGTSSTIPEANSSVRHADSDVRDPLPHAAHASPEG
jgi:hypothetical protein